MPEAPSPEGALRGVGSLARRLLLMRKTMRGEVKLDVSIDLFVDVGEMVDGVFVVLGCGEAEPFDGL